MLESLESSTSKSIKLSLGLAEALVTRGTTLVDDSGACFMGKFVTFGSVNCVGVEAVLLIESAEVEGCAVQL